MKFSFGRSSSPKRPETTKDDEDTEPSPPPSPEKPEEKSVQEEEAAAEDEKPVEDAAVIEEEESNIIATSEEQTDVKDEEHTGDASDRVVDTEGSDEQKEETDDSPQSNAEQKPAEESDVQTEDSEKANVAAEEENNKEQSEDDAKSAPTSPCRITVLPNLRHDVTSSTPDKTPQRDNTTSLPSTPNRPTNNESGTQSPERVAAAPPEDPPEDEEEPTSGSSSVPSSPPRVRILSAAPSPGRGSWLTGILSAKPTDGENNATAGHRKQSSITTRTLNSDEDSAKNFDEEISSQEDEEKKKKMAPAGGFCCSCCKGPIAVRHLCILAVILLLAIGGMAYFVHHLHQESTRMGAAAVRMTPPTNSPTMAPSGMPSVKESGSPSSAPTRSPTSPPSRLPSNNPSGGPTGQPSPSPTFPNPEDHFLSVIRPLSLSTYNRIRNKSGEHYDAFEWLINDPDYFTYSDKRVVQRYALVLFSYELTLPNQRNRQLRAGRELNPNALETWRQYTDECLWFTSYYQDRLGCDRSGTFRRLVLINLGLKGTIPSELTLLTKLGAYIFL